MTEGDIYEATDSYSKQHKIAYIHFRNVVGKVPDYNRGSVRRIRSTISDSWIIPAASSMVTRRRLR